MYTEVFPSSALSLLHVCPLVYTMLWLVHVAPTSRANERLHAVLRSLAKGTSLTAGHASGSLWPLPEDIVLGVGGAGEDGGAGDLARVRATLATASSAGSVHAMTEVCGCCERLCADVCEAMCVDDCVCRCVFGCVCGCM